MVDNQIIKEWADFVMFRIKARGRTCIILLPKGLGLTTCNRNRMDRLRYKKNLLRNSCPFEKVSEQESIATIEIRQQQSVGL